MLDQLGGDVYRNGVTRVQALTRLDEVMGLLSSTVPNNISTAVHKMTDVFYFPTPDDARENLRGALNLLGYIFIFLILSLHKGVKPYNITTTGSV